MQEKKTTGDFPRVTKIKQHRTNLVVSETIRKLLNMLVFGPWLCTKCSYQQKQTCFCWEEKFTQWGITATRNTVQAFWGTIGGSNLFQQSEGKAAPSLANLWPERTSHLSALLSSHNYPNTVLLVSLICFVYQATWTCIWSAREYACQ